MSHETLTVEQAWVVIDHALSKLGTTREKFFALPEYERRSTLRGLQIEMLRAMITYAEAAESLERGLKDAEAGRVHDRGDFTQYADDSEGEG